MVSSNILLTHFRFTSQHYRRKVAVGLCFFTSVDLLDNSGLLRNFGLYVPAIKGRLRKHIFYGLKVNFILHDFSSLLRQ